ncbi:MAG: protein kinase [Deltaproteobacteria bacterium]|nr:protein kinase [Deltaproteobacteria bacterium]MCL5792579.1 protein kinase [Deltaproteobacteria bacterium]
MNQLLINIKPYFAYIGHSIVNYTGKIMDPGTQILWGVIIILGVLFIIVHKMHRARKADINGEIQALEKKASRLLKLGRFVEAAKLYERANKIHEAADAYYNAGAIYYAAQLYKKLGIKDKEARALEQLGFYKEAGELYKELPMYDKAVENLLKAHELLQAATMLEATGNIEKAAKTYMSAGFNIKAGELFHKLGNNAMVATAYESGVVLPKGNIIPRAISNYALKSALAYNATGNIEKAAQVTERSGLFKQAAALYYKLDNFAKASELFLSAGDKKSAAKIMEKAGWQDKAALVMASYYEEKGMKREAIEQYEKLGRFEESAKLYETLGEKLKAADLYVKADKHVLAASIYRDMGYVDKSLSILESASEKDKQTEEAAALKLDLFLEKGMYKDAAAIIEQGLGGRSPSTANINLYYKLANIYEEEGRVKDAITIYNKLVKIDQGYLDITERIEKIKRLTEAPSPSVIDQYAKTVLLSDTGEGVLSKRYRLITELGRGGMGIVVKAQDIVLGRVVAVKLMSAGSATDPKRIDAFIREARTSASLNHPNIVTVYDVGEDRGAFYIVMEFVDGTILKKLLEDYPKGMDIMLCIFVSAQILKGLAYAHEKGIIHRDIKPSNIMWTPKRVAKLMDFGLAKAIEEIKHGETILGGTPLYMSPEQILGEKTDARTDIYSFGCTLYEMLTSKPPFIQGDIGYHHVHTEPPHLTDINTQIPAWLSDVVLKCLKKQPEQRYQSVEQLFNDMQAGYKTMKGTA